MKDAIVAVGQCVLPEKRGERFVKGYPPNNAYVVDAIIGGREKVRRMYAEESLEETEKEARIPHYIPFRLKREAKPWWN